MSEITLQDAAKEARLARLPLSSFLRRHVPLGPFGPNSQTVIADGGTVMMTPAEAERMEAAARAYLFGEPHPTPTPAGPASDDGGAGRG